GCCGCCARCWWPPSSSTHCSDRPRANTGSPMLQNLLARKPIEPAGHVDAGEPFEGSLEGEATLKRTLTVRHLVLMGMGAVIGAGIFVVTGQAAAEHAGPAIMLSFVMAGFACALAGL